MKYPKPHLSYIALNSVLPIKFIVYSLTFKIDYEKSLEDIGIIIETYVYINLVLFALTYLQFLDNSLLDLRNLRFAGFFTYSNQLATVLLPLLPIGFIFSQKYRTVIFIISTMILLAATGSDGGLILGVIFLLFFGAFYEFKATLFVVVLSVFFLTVLNSILINLPGFKVVLAKVNQLFVEGTVDDSNRFFLWSVAINNYFNSLGNIIFGYGAGYFELFLANNYSIGQSVHNTPLGILYDFGLIIFSIINIYLAFIFKILYDVVGKHSNVIVGSIVILMVFGLFHWVLKSRIILILLIQTWLIYEIKYNKK